MRLARMKKSKNLFQKTTKKKKSENHLTNLIAISCFTSSNATISL